MPRESTTGPWNVGPARVRRVRGPDGDGRTYWRAVVRDEAGERLVWSGWCLREDAAASKEILTGALAGTRDQAARPTMKDLLGKYRGHVEQRQADGAIAARSLNVYKGQIKYLSKSLGAVLVEELDRDTLTDYVRARRVTSSTRTVKLELDRLEAAWEWGRKRGHAPSRDLDVPEIAVEPVRNRYTPTRPEILKVIERLAGWSRRCVVLLAATGARLGEIADLTWADVDLRRLELHLDGKTGKRVVPISTDVVRELGAPGRPNELVHGAAASTVRCNLLDVLEEACAAAEVHRITPHGLRRAAVDDLYDSGVLPDVEAAGLGHSVNTAIRHYRRARPQAIRRGFEAAGLGRIPEGQVVDFPSQARVTTKKKAR